MMKQLETFGICKAGSKRCSCANTAAGVAGHAAGTGLTKVVLKRESRFPKMELER